MKKHSPLATLAAVAAAALIAAGCSEETVEPVGPVDPVAVPDRSESAPLADDPADAPRPSAANIEGQPAAGSGPAAVPPAGGDTAAAAPAGSDANTTAASGPDSSPTAVGSDSAQRDPSATAPSSAANTTGPGTADDETRKGPSE